MIIECKNCLKKFTVRDSDIPIQGRIVQCSNCSSQWQQMPIGPSVTTANLDVDKLAQKRSSNEFMASYGKTYKFKEPFILNYRRKKNYGCNLN